MEKGFTYFNETSFLKWKKIQDDKNHSGAFSNVNNKTETKEPLKPYCWDSIFFTNSLSLKTFHYSSTDRLQETAAWRNDGLIILSRYRKPQLCMETDLFLSVPRDCFWTFGLRETNWKKTKNLDFKGRHLEAPDWDDTEW